MAAAGVILKDIIGLGGALQLSALMLLVGAAGMAVLRGGQAPQGRPLG